MDLSKESHTVQVYLTMENDFYQNDQIFSEIRQFFQPKTVQIFNVSNQRYQRFQGISMPDFKRMSLIPFAASSQKIVYFQ